MCFAYRSSLFSHFLKSLLLLCRWIASKTEVFNFIFIFHQIFWWKVSSIVLKVNLAQNSEDIFFLVRISFWNTSWNTSLLMFQEAKNDNQYEQNNKIHTEHTHISPYLCQLHLYLGQCQSYTCIYCQELFCWILTHKHAHMYIVHIIRSIYASSRVSLSLFSFSVRSFCFEPFRVTNALHFMSCTEICLFSTPISSKC